MGKFGILVTIIYVGVILFIRWESLPLLATMPLNEFGDFFAGVFGPLMLFWLILGYIQQQKELRQNTAALELQAEELNKSVQQHKELVKATKEQVANEVKSIKLNEERYRKSAQPEFYITSAGRTMISGGKTEYQVKIKNQSRPATNVQISTQPEVHRPIKIEYFSSNEETKFKWKLEDGNEPPNSLMVKIVCTDSSGNDYQKSLFLILREHKYVQERIES